MIENFMGTTKKIQKNLTPPLSPPSQNGKQLGLLVHAAIPHWLSTIYIPNGVHYLFWPRLIEGHELWGQYQSHANTVFLQGRVRENVKSAKEIECTPCKKYRCKFFPQSALCPICFHIVIPNHVLGPCYACFWHVRKTCYVPFGTFLTCYVLFETFIPWKVMNTKHARVSLNLFLKI